MIIKKYKFCLPIMVLVGVLYIILAWNMNINGCPDEPMRLDLANWIAANGTLPTGYEYEIINPIWGYSYAFTPYLPSMIGGLFARIASIFTSNEHVLLFAVRLVSVISGLGAVFVSFRVGDKVYKNTAAVYFMACLVAFWPQVVFLSGYHNNDVPSLFFAFIVLDAMISGIKNGWNYKNMMYLSVGVSLVALTYFFAYGWIILAVTGFFYTASKQGLKQKEIWSKAGIITLAVFVLAGWYFIRNGIIYNGDFLGMKQNDLCAALYEEQYNVHPVNWPGSYTTPFFQMLFERGWLKWTIESFIGLFGGLVIALDKLFYAYYYFYFLACFLLFGIYVFKKQSKFKPVYILALVAMILIPLGLSAYSSYMRDYSAQGRYIISSIPAIVLIMGEGMDKHSSMIKNKSGKLGKWFDFLAIFGWSIMFLVIVYFIMLPTLCEIYLPGSTFQIYHVR